MQHHPPQRPDQLVRRVGVAELLQSGHVPIEQREVDAEPARAGLVLERLVNVRVSNSG